VSSPDKAMVRNFFTSVQFVKRCLPFFGKRVVCGGGPSEQGDFAFISVSLMLVSPPGPPSRRQSFFHRISLTVDEGDCA